MASKWADFVKRLSAAPSCIERVVTLLRKADLFFDGES